MTSCTGHPEVKAWEGCREEAGRQSCFQPAGKETRAELAQTWRQQLAAGSVQTATLNRRCKGRVDLRQDPGSSFCWFGPVRTGGRLEEGGEKKGEEQEDGKGGGEAGPAAL